jgi:TetR/AcrR family transcriptional regulator, cholesterol catabolism regulator
MTGIAISDLTPRQEARRQRILRTALELAAEGGYDAVQMRAVSTRAKVALGTIYRYFASKDDLLVAVMVMWTHDLQERVLEVPPRGRTATDRLVDVYLRGCRAMERQPTVTAAMITALSSSGVGLADNAAEVRRTLSDMAAGVLGGLDEQTRDRILRVINHVWHSTLVAWTSGRRPFSWVMAEMESAIRLVMQPYDPPLEPAAAAANTKTATGKAGNAKTAQRAPQRAPAGSRAT